MLILYQLIYNPYNCCYMEDWPLLLRFFIFSSSRCILMKYKIPLLKICTIWKNRMSVSLQQRRYLLRNLPFTKCHDVHNVLVFIFEFILIFYQTSHHYYYKDFYTQSTCAMDGLIKRIIEKCGCIPHYFPHNESFSF